MAGLNELMAEIYESGASLVVKDSKLGINGKVTDRLRASIRENHKALTEYLTYDQEAAYELLKAARAYISERYRTGSELEPNDFDERIALAEAREDMWTLRIAVREWVLAWLTAIAQAKSEAAA